MAGWVSYVDDEGRQHIFVRRALKAQGFPVDAEHILGFSATLLAKAPKEKFEHPLVLEVEP